MLSFFVSLKAVQFFYSWKDLFLFKPKRKTIIDFLFTLNGAQFFNASKAVNDFENSASLFLSACTNRF